MVNESCPMRADGRQLIISPSAPVLEVGSTLQLTCISPCETTPEWEFSTDIAPGKTQRHDSMSILTIARVTEAHRGRYTCTVECPKYLSKRVNLKVYSFPERPKLELEPKDYAGQTAHLTCSGYNIYPCDNAKVLWYQDDDLRKLLDPQIVYEDDRCNMTSKWSVLVNSSDERISFTCVIQLEDQIFARNTTLEIHLKTGLHELQLEPTTVRAQTGDELILNCSAQGSPQPVIEWKKDSQDHKIPPYWTITHEVGRSELRISHLSPADEGVYYCIITSGNSRAELNTSVDVHYGPRYTRIKGPEHVQENEPVTIVCSGEASPEANVTWRKLDPSTAQGWTVSRANSSSILTIQSFRPEDQGVYECLLQSGIHQVRLNVSIALSVMVKNKTLATWITPTLTVMCVVLFIATFFILFRKRLSCNSSKFTDPPAAENHTNT
eukprot:gi/632961924/ref/XP_007897028.1/ PREDICTED: vascular cell adhesion protein 1-like isoform X2 [Callorhinchus milii]